MRRLSLRKCHWMYLSFLALAMAAPSACAQTLPADISAWAGSISPDWTPAPTDQSSPASAPLYASSTPPVPPYNCTLNGPNWIWGVSGNVSYSVDNSTWTSPPDNSYSAWTVHPDPASSDATFQVLFYVGGYWKFPCDVGVYYDDSPCGDAWFGTTTCTVDPVKSLELLSLTVVSGATQDNTIGGTNWATVMTQPGDSVLLQALTMPNTPDAWSQLLWTGGTEGASANQRTVDKGTSAMTFVVVGFGQLQYSAYIWVIWATIVNQVTDKTPPNAVQFGDLYDKTENLGAKTWNNGNVANGKVVPIATVTPAGVNAVITGGFAFKRDTWRHTFVNGAKGPFYDATWQPDNSDLDVQAPQAADGKTLVLDTKDRCYDRDAPGIGGAANIDSVEAYANFQEYLQWNGTLCSFYTGWYWQARWKANAAGTSQVDSQFTKVAQGALDLSKYTTAFYPPPAGGGACPPGGGGLTFPPCGESE